MNLTCEQCRLHHVSGGTSYCGIDRAPAYKPDSCRHDAIPDLLSDLAALESENAKLREVVEKLPMTKDGARVVPTFDTVYHPEWDTYYLPLEVWGAEHHLFEETLGLAELPPDIDPADIDFIAVGFYYEDDTGASDEGIYLVSDCYSTSEAAAIAKAKGGE